MEETIKKQVNNDYDAMHGDALLTPTEASEYLGYTKDYLEKLARKKSVPREGLNKNRPYKLADLRRYQEEKQSQPLYILARLNKGKPSN